MARSEKPKFDALNKLQKARSTASPAVIEREPITEQHLGRPPGKRRLPGFRPTTLILRAQTIRTARRKLEDAESGLDLSDQVEKLLTEWIEQGQV